MPTIVGMEKPLVGPKRQRMEARFRELMTAFKKQLSVRLTVAEKVVLRRAAAMTARSEAITFDLRASNSDIINMDGSAAQAREAWARVVKARLSRDQVPVDVDMLDEDVFSEAAE
jgi:hypothetical protein